MIRLHHILYPIRSANSLYKRVSTVANKRPVKIILIIYAEAVIISVGAVVNCLRLNSIQVMVNVLNAGAVLIIVRQSMKI
jgi:hypothetical protein